MLPVLCPILHVTYICEQLLQVPRTIWQVISQTPSELRIRVLVSLLVVCLSAFLFFYFRSRSRGKAQGMDHNSARGLEAQSAVPRHVIHSTTRANGPSPSAHVATVRAPIATAGARLTVGNEPALTTDRVAQRPIDSPRRPGQEETRSSHSTTGLELDSRAVSTGGSDGEDTRTETSGKSMNAGFNLVGLEQLTGRLGAAHPLLRKKVSSSSAKWRTC